MDEIRRIVTEEKPDDASLEEAIAVLAAGGSSAAEALTAREAIRWLEGQLAGRRLERKIARKTGGGTGTKPGRRGQGITEYVLIVVLVAVVAVAALSALQLGVHDVYEKARQEVENADPATTPVPAPAS